MRPTSEAIQVQLGDYASDWWKDQTSTTFCHFMLSLHLWNGNREIWELVGFQLVLVCEVTSMTIIRAQSFHQTYVSLTDSRYPGDMSSV